MDITNKIIQVMREEYRRRLIETIDESDVFDEKGNLIITKDLKVRHKDSQFEYTVDDVLTDPESGKVQIVLRLPEEPRVEPEGEEGMILDGDCPSVGSSSDKKISVSDPGPPPDMSATGAAVMADATMALGEDDLIEPTYDTETGIEVDDDDEIVFVVDQEEFEKEYEVK